MLLDIRRDLDRQLAPHRRRMSAAQLAQLEDGNTCKSACLKISICRGSAFFI